MKCVRFLAPALAGLLLQAQGPGQTTHTSKVDVPHNLVAESLEVARRALVRKDFEQAVLAYQEALDKHAFEVIVVRESPRGANDTEPVHAGDIFRRRVQLDRARLGPRADLYDLVE